LKLLIDTESGIQIAPEGSQMVVTTGNNTIEMETFKGKLKLYERNGELEIAREGVVVWSSYSAEGDSWKDWGPETKKTPSK
jgi:hypothetical protein